MHTKCLLSRVCFMRPEEKDQLVVVRDRSHCSEGQLGISSSESSPRLITRGGQGGLDTRCSLSADEKQVDHFAE
jgi:hypothetical protein